jgi:hypothetical protein
MVHYVTDQAIEQQYNYLQIPRYTSALRDHDLAVKSAEEAAEEAATKHEAPEEEDTPVTGPGVGIGKVQKPLWVEIQALEGLTCLSEEKKKKCIRRAMDLWMMSQAERELTKHIEMIKEWTWMPEEERKLLIDRVESSRSERGEVEDLDGDGGVLFSSYLNVFSF